MGDDHFLRPDNDMMKQPESPVDVKLYEFGRLLDDVLDASYDCEIRGLSYRADNGFGRRYRLARERLMGAISAALQDNTGEKKDADWR